MKALAIFSLGIVACFSFFISGAWFSDSKRGSAVWITIAAICIISALALSGCGAGQIVKTAIDACLERKC